MTVELELIQRPASELRPRSTNNVTESFRDNCVCSPGRLVCNLEGFYATFWSAFGPDHRFVPSSGRFLERASKDRRFTVTEAPEDIVEGPVPVVVHRV